MKKSIILMLFILLIAGCSSPEPQPLAGGIYTAKYDERGERALLFALDEMELSGVPYQVSLYKRQVVSGMNHFFIARIEDTSYEIKVYEDVRGKFSLVSHKIIQ